MLGHTNAEPENQAAADRWAGCALKTLGQPVEPFLLTLRSMGAGRDRLGAAWQGWDDCATGGAIVETTARPNGGYW